MKKLYEKSELGFALLWIGIYVAGTSLADEASRAVGLEKSVTLTYTALLTIILLAWTVKNRLTKKYGLCRSKTSAGRFLFYIPLLALASCNLWQGAAMNYSLLETALYVGSMLCVGFLEEMIFRGLLFKAMSKNSILSAIIVSSLTFGIGHIVNLINGSGADLVSNLCQVCYATAAGFLFVIIFHRGGSLLPCILTHSCFNALSAFAPETDRSWDITVSIIITVIEIAYALVLLRTLPAQSPASEE